MEVGPMDEGNYADSNKFITTYIPIPEYRRTTEYKRKQLKLGTKRSLRNSQKMEASLSDSVQVQCKYIKSVHMLRIQVSGEQV